jgi:hypothetical protein
MLENSRNSNPLQPRTSNPPKESGTAKKYFVKLVVAKFEAQFRLKRSKPPRGGAQHSAGETRNAVYVPEKIGR